MPEYTQISRPVEGIQIISDVRNQFGIETLEGRIGPLLQGVASRAHYIDMPAGLYLHEHPHPTEAIIYTVRGRYVLVTGGKRTLMEPGSLFWFGPDMAAGYEVPFDEPSMILIFKAERGWNPDQFIDYLENTLRPRLLAEGEGGEPLVLRELAADHPARVYARQVNPQGNY